MKRARTKQPAKPKAKDRAPTCALGRWLKRTETEQKELAARCGVTPALISQYLKGKTKPRGETLRKLSNATGIAASTLYADFFPTNPTRRVPVAAHDSS